MVSGQPEAAELQLRAAATGWPRVAGQMGAAGLGWAALWVGSTAGWAAVGCGLWAGAL